MIKAIKEYVKNKDILETLVVFLVTFSLYCSFTNYVYLSALATFIILLFVPFAIKDGLKLKSISGYLLLIFAYFAISALIVHPSQLLSFEFYRRDGNVFITFAPLLTLGICKYKFDINKILRNFVLISTVANVLGIIKFIFFRTAPEYFMFFTAHNAAGGFLAMVTIFNIYVLSITKNKKWIFTVCLIINIVGLYLTDSRGSILPLILALAIYLLERRFKNIDLYAIILAFIVVFAVAFYISTVRGYGVFIEKYGFELPVEFKDNAFINKIFSFDRAYTAIDRLFYLWPMAVQMFIYSPILGAGMGTFNDDIRFVGKKGLAYFNVGEYYNSSAHAHNTYLHVLAENGIIGLVLVVLLIMQIRKFVKNLEDKKLGITLFIALLYAVFSGFLEHRLFTPAQMIPLVLILGMAISNTNAKKSEKNVENSVNTELHLKTQHKKNRGKIL